MSSGECPRVFEESEVPMLHSWNWSEPSWIEPSLAETLSDPVIQAVMAADPVDPQALDALLHEIALKVKPRLPLPQPAGPGAQRLGPPPSHHTFPQRLSTNATRPH